MTVFHIKRIYDEVSDDDGYRVLVDRLWPRGVSKEKAKLDEWCKDVAPSNKLRQWFDHDPAKYTEFKKRYKAELEQNSVLSDALKTWKKQDKVSLLYGAHDTEHNQAVVLQEFLKS